MASIEKRTSKEGNITYRVKVRMRGYPEETATFTRLTDARIWAQETETAIRNGKYFKTSESKKHTLKELIERYKKEILSEKKNESDYTTQLQWWSDSIGDYALSNITSALLTEHRNKLLLEPSTRRPTRSKATVNRYCSALSHAFTVAVKEWEWMSDNPMLKIKKYKESRGRIRYLKEEERERLLKACKESNNKIIYLLAVLSLSTGARKMEILGLKWDEIDLDRKVITLHRTKNNERRILPLTGFALELLKEHLKVRRIDTDLVFPGSNPKKPVDIRTPWETVKKKAEIEDFRWHDLRHTCASYLAMDGASPGEIAEILGHKTLAMVKRYAHLSDSHVISVVEKMNSKVFGG